MIYFLNFLDRWVFESPIPVPVFTMSQVKHWKRKSSRAADRPQAVQRAVQYRPDRYLRAVHRCRIASDACDQEDVC
jgi:hypothetical protein